MNMKNNLELYVHTPFCVKKCDYCDFLSFAADSKTQIQYVHALLKEIRFYGELMQSYEVSTIYIGGGTPSWLEPELLIAIMEQIYKSFQVREDAEITLECNPGTVTIAKFGAYKKVGINRLSIGMQSANDDELKALGRIHTFEQFLKTYKLARNLGFHNINVDIMSGLPHQTVEKFTQTLQKVIRLKPEHISAYSLIIEKGTPFYDRYKFDVVRQEAGMKTEELPSEDEAYKILKKTQSMLKEAGYHHYEVSNFAKPGYECQHNIGYWVRENYLGLGLGAASLIDNVRYSNTRELYEYNEICGKLTTLPPEAFAGEEGMPAPEGHWFGTNLHTEANVITRKGQMEEFMFLGLRLTGGVTRKAFEDAFGMPIEAVYPEVLRQLKDQQLIQQREGRIKLTDRGMDVANYVMAQFLL